MKQILNFEEIENNIFKIRIEATKRRTLYIKRDIEGGKFEISCSEFRCPLYRNCSELPSPLYPKYKTFGEFCNMLYVEYPGLREILKAEVNDTVPIKKNR